MPGVLKTALDWAVGSGELIDKPVALINALRATHAWNALVELGFRPDYVVSDLRGILDVVFGASHGH